MTKKIAITTGGGDAPGLNAVIRAATLAALNRGWEVWGIRNGYDGLLTPEKMDESPLIRLTADTVRGITHLGGTILGTTNRGNPLSYPVTHSDGTVERVDISGEFVRKFHEEHKFDAMIAIGGDGSMAIADALCKKGVPIVGVPKTIDNDLDGTVVTFGFDTAVSFATECIGRLHSTAASHDRVMVVEVMGRHAGWIALYAGVAGTADAILIPEIPYDINNIIEKIEMREEAGRDFSIIVVAEGAKPADGTLSYVEKAGEQKLGGVGQRVTEQIHDLTGKSARCVVLGHLLRGGTPTARDRELSLRFGAAAVRAIEAGQSGVMVSLDPPIVRTVPLEQCTQRTRTVPLDGDMMLTARDLGIAFGD